MSTNISLTPELESYARSQVESGLYGSISEFVRDTIRMHRQKSMEQEIYLRQMHQELAKSSDEINNNDISPLNMSEILDDVLDKK